MCQKNLPIRLFRLLLNKLLGLNLLNCLVKFGFPYKFGYPGNAILPIYDELFSWEQNTLAKQMIPRHIETQFLPNAFKNHHTKGNHKCPNGKVFPMVHDLQVQLLSETQVPAGGTCAHSEAQVQINCR